MIDPERMEQILAHAARHEGEGFKDNDVSVLLAEVDRLQREAKAAREGEAMQHNANKKMRDDLDANIASVRALGAAELVCSHPGCAAFALRRYCALHTLQSLGADGRGHAVRAQDALLRIRHGALLIAMGTDRWREIGGDIAEIVDSVTTAHEDTRRANDVERLRAALNIDRSGLGRALDTIRRRIRDLIPPTQDDDPGEVSAALAKTLEHISEVAADALKASGDLATAAIRGEPHADLDASLTLTLTPREVQCLAKCAATYSLLRSTEGKPTSIIDGIAAKLPKVAP